MKKILSSLLAVTLLFLSACEKENNFDLLPEQETIYDGTADDRESKVNVCHDGNIINVNENAIPAFLNQGDAVDLDGDGFFHIDNPCSETDCDDASYDPENSCACVEGEYEVLVDPDGTPESGDEYTIYVHPILQSNGTPWGDGRVDIQGIPNLGSTVTSDFNGEENTAAIIEELGNWNDGNYAANICASLATESGCEWYLPAWGELSAINQQLEASDFNAISGNQIFWSSWSSSERFPAFTSATFYIEGIVSTITLVKVDDTIGCLCVRK